MATLTQAPVAPLLQRLFAQAETNRAELHRGREALQLRGLGPADPEHRALMARAYLAVTPEIGRLLHVLARARRARTVVEFGTSFGISTVHLAAAVRDNGGGVVVGTEAEPAKAAAARAHLVEAGLDDLVEILPGDARQSLAARAPGPVDLLFLDGHGRLYVEVLELVRPWLAPGAVVVADNATEPGYREHVRALPGAVSVPHGDRVEITVVD